MSNRWKMNRMGFVNFWLYDEETFEFEDGKLLLRGQNGSGKSITTQSFIPFILDGDRTPSRLDPFGSSDRKMEYYFLGEEGREESTGYLFLEFYKESTGQYRTIGIGQRARRGAAMTFWGFVLTDGRRVGYDIQLYKEVGSTKLPCSKQDLKKLLGPEVPFTDSPGEYKALVNKYIFGFRRMEQYEQFIRLLVKVRAPKLSKEFKPTKVYDILNESLQTLTDEELRAMVDAMEKMDSIQNNLELLRTAQRDAQIIHNEYTRYNQYMLARKAGEFLKANEQAERLKVHLESEEETQQSLEQEEQEKRRLREQTEQRKKLVETKLDSLKETDLEQVSKRLFDSRNQQEMLAAEKIYWEEKAENAREHLLETDRKCREYESKVENLRDDVKDSRRELEEIQEILRFSGHEQIQNHILREEVDSTGELSESIREWRQKISRGGQLLKEQEELERKYDGAVEKRSKCQAGVVEKEARLEGLKEEEENARDTWIEGLYELPKRNQEFLPERQLLEEMETEVLAYQGVKDRFKILQKGEQYVQNKRRDIFAMQNRNQQEIARVHLELTEKKEEWKELQNRQEWEPERNDTIKKSRELLTAAGISWIPFYQAVEFAADLSREEQGLLEEQLKKAGFLDALVVERSNWQRIKRELPEYADMLICPPKNTEGTSFEKLVPNGELEDGLRKEIEWILKAISEEDGELILGGDGFFQNGMLKGRSLGKEESVFIGQLSRKRRLKQQMELLAAEIQKLEEQIAALEEEKEVLKKRLEVLEQEFQEMPDGALLDEILSRERDLEWYLAKEQEELKKLIQEEESLKQQREQALQQVIRICRELPYARTYEAYQEAKEAAGEYLDHWTCIGENFLRLQNQKALLESEREKGEQYEENQETAIRESKSRKKQLEILALAIHEAEEFLNSPKNRQLAERLAKLRTEEKSLHEKLQELGERLAVIENERGRIAQSLEEKKTELVEQVGKETALRSYFEEELDLKLVMERGAKGLKECAKEALDYLRELDKNREAGDVINALHQVYHKYSSSLISYGISMEDCFAEGGIEGNFLRKRQRIVAVLNGKKLYFAQFCQAIKTSIEETELLIQKKDRELFVDILSRTLSQQLTERIAESRQWVMDMSALMKQMDTSMGLSFSLDWRPKSAQSAQEIDTMELEKLLRRDQKLLTSEDVERVAGHFRSKIRAEKLKVEEEGGAVNYMDLVRDALDYRKWFEFQMFYYRNQDGKKPLTNAAFNKFSGGEKAMAMYVPLFAAVNAQYQKSAKEDFPRIIALDEAFAGVDDKNISSMFELVQTLDFDYIMNSQAIWGCHETVPALRISELHRPADTQVVTVIHYTWNGHERILNEQ